MPTLQKLLYFFAQVSVWTQLPDSYFPRWYSAGNCTGSSCSLPEGLTCEPDIGYATLLVLYTISTVIVHVIMSYQFLAFHDAISVVIVCM